MKDTHIMVHIVLQHIQIIFVVKYMLFQMYNILHPLGLNIQNIHHNLFHSCNLDFLVGPAVVHSSSMIRSLSDNSS